MTTANTMVDGSGRLICSIKGTSLNQAEIFVFGSNAAGRHAGGAARYAMDHFGAKFGRGHGLHGRSYAVDTMSGIQVLNHAKLHADLRALIQATTPAAESPTVAG